MKIINLDSKSSIRRAGASLWNQIADGYGGDNHLMSRLTGISNAVSHHQAGERLEFMREVGINKRQYFLLSLEKESRTCSN